MESMSTELENVVVATTETVYSDLVVFLVAGVGEFFNLESLGTSATEGFVTNGDNGDFTSAFGGVAQSLGE